MPEIQIINALVCPKLNEYIALEDCFKCPLFSKSRGYLKVKCGYTFKKLEAEPSEIKEPVSKW